MLPPSPLPVTAGPVFRSLSTAFAGQFLQINFTSYTSFNLSGSPRSTYPRVNFYLDLDNNPATGWQVAGGTCGSELLVQGDRTYR